MVLPFRMRFMDHSSLLSCRRDRAADDADFGMHGVVCVPKSASSVARPLHKDTKARRLISWPHAFAAMALSAARLCDRLWRSVHMDKTTGAGQGSRYAAAGSSECSNRSFCGTGVCASRRYGARSGIVGENQTEPA